MGNYSTLSPSTKSRDPRWLQVEVCREFVRDRCLRSDDECRFAHPPPGCLVEDGKVTACFDAMKGRCQRDKCKYLHPPDHIKSHLETLGRSFQHNRSRTISQQAMLSDMLGDMRIHPVSAEQFPGYQSPPNQLQPEQTYVPSNIEAMATVSPRQMGYPRRADKSDKLKACEDFINGCCELSDDDCLFAHSPEHISIDGDGLVTVCMDYVKGHCQRSTCRYFHPTRSMVAKVRAVQYRPSHFTKMPHQNSIVYPHGTPPYMYMPTYYQHQLVNPQMYPYQSYMPPGMQQQAAYIMQAAYPYAVQSPPPYVPMMNENAGYTQHGEIQAVNLIPVSPASTASPGTSPTNSAVDLLPTQ